MTKLLQSLFEKCAVTIDISDERIRLSAKGLIGIVGLLLLLLLLVHYMPQLIASVSGR